MTKTRRGGNKDGIGFYELLRLGLNRSCSVYFYLTLLMIKFHLYTLTKKFLGIH